MDKAEKIFKTEVKWVWTDEDDVICSPIHDTLGTALRFKGNWKPWDEHNRFRKNYGSKKLPRYLRKVEIIYRFAISADAKIISEAFAKSDDAEADHES